MSNDPFLCEGMVGQSVSIRNLGPEDAHILDRVVEGVFERPHDPARVYAYLATRVNELVVALSDGQVVGFVCGTTVLHPNKPTMFMVYDLRVAEAFRRQGVAKRLSQRITELARDRGCEEIWGTAGHDEPALKHLGRSVKAEPAGPHSVLRLCF